MLSALSFKKSFAIGIAILTGGFCCGNAYAQEKTASFNSSFLMGSARDMDTSLYSHGNPKLWDEKGENIIPCST